MNELIHDTSLYEDIPDGTGRLPREIAVYELLSRLEIPFKRMDHEAMATIEACWGVDEILGISMERVISWATLGLGRSQTRISETPSGTSRFQPLQ